jgi:hypothetical protein
VAPQCRECLRVFGRRAILASRHRRVTEACSITDGATLSSLVLKQTPLSPLVLPIKLELS